MHAGATHVHTVAGMTHFPRLGRLLCDELTVASLPTINSLSLHYNQRKTFHLGLDSFFTLFTAIKDS